MKENEWPSQAYVLLYVRDEELFLKEWTVEELQKFLDFEEAMWKEAEYRKSLYEI